MLFGKRLPHNPFDYFLTLKGMVGMLRDPEHTASVFDIEDGLKGLAAPQNMVKYVRQDPGVSKMIEDRWLAPLPNIQELAQLPQGSLGWCFAHHLIEHGFDPDYYRTIDTQTDIDYVLMRMRQTHDLWHVLTGIDTSRIGEISLKAFELAQTRRPMAAVITTGGVMRYLIHDPDELGRVLEGISYGYRLGLNAKPMLAQTWEEGWDRPLADWRAEVNLPIPVQLPKTQELCLDPSPDGLICDHTSNIQDLARIPRQP